MTLEETIRQVSPLDREKMELAQKRWDSIAKPLHSLGRLESMVIQIAGMTAETDPDLKKRALIAMCADNGVVAEGVTQTGQEVTAIVAENFLKGETSACVMCRESGTDIFPVDIGMAADTKVTTRWKIRRGTDNMTQGPAMTRAEAVRAIEAGIDVVRDRMEAGYRLLATGEMGIGNTTTSSAVASVLLDEPIEKMTGRGAGLSTEGLNRKILAIKKAVEKNRPDRNDPVDVLSKVGGLDIAGLTGVFLAGAAFRIPVVMDGFISCVAALAAVRLCPGVRDYLIASHVSREPAAKRILEALGKEAVLHADMCLGEGTGAVALFPVLDMGYAVYRSMSTFTDIAVEQYRELT